MNDQKIIDVSHKIADELEHEVDKKMLEMEAYQKGYIQACEDFGRRLRMIIYEQPQEMEEDEE